MYLCVFVCICVYLCVFYVFVSFDFAYQWALPVGDLWKINKQIKWLKMAFNGLKWHKMAKNGI